MLNRKENKTASGAEDRSPRPAPAAAPKPRPHRRRFIISPKAPGVRPEAGGEPVPASSPKPSGAAITAKAAPAADETPAGEPRAATLDLNETIKTLVHLAHEHGHVTFDDINDVLPEGLSPDDLDELYTKLRNLDIEIVDHAEVERSKPVDR